MPRCMDVEFIFTFIFTFVRNAFRSDLFFLALGSVKFE